MILPTKHGRALMNSLWKCSCFEIKSEFSVLIFVEGGTQNPEKNPRNKARTNTEINPLMKLGAGFEHGLHLEEGNSLYTTQPLLPYQCKSKQQHNNILKLRLYLVFNFLNIS